MTGLFVCGLLSLLFLALHTRPARQWVLRTLVERLSALAPGRLSIGSLEYRLWRGDAAVRDVRFEPSGGGAIVMGSVEEVRVRWIFPGRVEVIALRPVVELGAAPEDPERESRAVEPSFPNWISELRVVEGEIDFRDGENRMEMGPLDVHLKADLASGGARGTIHVGGGSAVFGPRSLAISRVEADVRLANGNIEVRLREMLTDVGAVEGTGLIEELSPFGAGFDLDFRLDAARVGKALLGKEAEEIRGEVRGTVRLELAEEDFASEGRVEGTGLFFREIGPVDGNTSFRLRNDLLQLDGAFRHGSTRLELDAALDLERSAQTFTLRLDASSMNALLREAGTAPAPWDSTVHAQISARMERFSPDTLRGRGILTLAGRELKGRVDLEAEPGRLTVATRKLAFPGGRALVEARVDGLEMVAAEYEIRIDDLPTTVRPFLEDGSSWIDGPLRVDGRASGRLREPASLRNVMSLQSDALRLRGIPFLLEAELEQRGSTLDFGRLSLATLETGTAGQISLSGTVDFSQRTLNIEGSLDSFPTQALLSADGLLATAAGAFEASGDFERPSGEVRIDVTPVAVSEGGLPPIRLEARSDGQRVTAEIQRLDSGAGLARANIGLGESYLLEGDVELDSLPWAELASMLPPGSPELSSIEVAGDAHFQVPLTEMSLLEADVEVQRAGVSIRERAIATSPFQLNVRRDAVEVSDLALFYGEEALSIDGVVGITEGASTSLAIEGNVLLELAEGFLPGREVEGVLALNLELSRSLRDPSLSGDIEVVGGRLSAAGRAETVPAIENLEMRAKARGTFIEVEFLEAELLGGTLDVRGTVPAPLATVSEPARLTFDVAAIDVAGLAETVRGARAVATSISISGTVLFPEDRLLPFDASGEIEEVLLASEGGIIYLVAPSAWSYGSSGASVGEILLEGDRTELRFAVSPGDGEDEGGARVRIDGQADLQIANSLLPESTYLAGVAALDLNIASGPEGSVISGTAEVSEGELAIEDPAFAVTDVSADLELDSGLLRVRTLTARAGGGTLSAEGALTIPGSTTEESGIRLDLEAERVGIEYPEGLKSLVTARLGLESRDERYLLSGEIDIDRALFERPISPEREFLDAIGRQTLKLKGEPGLGGRIDLDLAVSTERDVVVDNNLGEMRWDAGLLVSGTLAAPEANGTLSAMPGGTLTLLGNRYELERAEIILDSYPLDPPELDIQARTEVGGKELVLSITGKSDNLRTTLESPTDPALSRGDVASLLLTGRTLEEVKGREVDVIGQEAAAYLGSSLAALTETGLATALPMTTVRLEPGIVGSETDPGVRFSIGRPLAEDVFLTYSIGLDDPEKQLWIIDFSLPRRLTLRAIRDDQNNYTGGLSQEVLFDFYDRNRPKRLDELPKPEIVSIGLEGDASLAPEEIEEALELEVGDGYDYWKARDDADELVKKLRAEGRLSAEVEPRTLPPEAASGEPLALVYDIESGPLVKIVWRGDPVPENLRKETSERFEGYAPPRAQALRIGRELQWELMARGNYAAEVEADVRELEEKVDVTYTVDLGPPGSGVEIAIEGNDNLPDDVIARLLPDPGSPEFFELVVGRTEKLREDVELLYAGEGYLESSVSELSYRFDPETKTLFVLLRVEEGDQFRVGGVAFSGASSFPEERLRTELELADGAPFRFLTHLRDQKRVASFYRGEGFPDVRVRSSLDRHEKTVDVVVEIDEGERVRVGDIRIAGAKATRERVIRSALTFEPGDPLRLSDLTETQRRLNNLRVFRSVDVRPEPSDDDGTRDVVVDLTELPDLRLGYGGRYDTEDHLELTGDVVLTNVLGTGRQMGFHAFANRNRTELRATFDIPSFLGRDVGSSLFVARETEEGDGFESRAVSATFQQGRRLFSNVLAQWSFTHRQSAVTQTFPLNPFGLDIEADRSVLSFSLIEDTRSSLTRPTSGRFWNATLQFAPKFLGSDLRFIKLYGQFFLYRTLWGEVVWASTYRAGIANGFGQILLPNDRFRAGGPSSVRGYPVNELGPPDPIAGSPIGGEGVIVMNQELRVPLFWRLGGIAFYDAGNVFLESSDFNPLDLRHTTGLGVSVELPVGLVTVDWAVLLNPPPDLPRTRWVFTFGYSF